VLGEEPRDERCPRTNVEFPEDPPDVSVNRTGRDPQLAGYDDLAVVSNDVSDDL